MISGKKSALSHQLNLAGTLGIAEWLILMVVAGFVVQAMVYGR